MTRLTRGDLRAAALAAAMVLLLLPAAPVSAVGTGVKSLSAGTGSACAIKTGDTLWCGGASESGAIGDGTVGAGRSPGGCGAAGDEEGSGAPSPLHDGNTSRTDWRRPAWPGFMGRFGLVPLEAPRG